MSTQVAGWYPDSSAPGTLRWWDGEQWTEDTQPEAPSVKAAVQSPSLGELALDQLRVPLIPILGVIFTAGLVYSSINLGRGPMPGLALGLALFGLTLLAFARNSSVYRFFVDYAGERGFDWTPRGNLPSGVPVAGELTHVMRGDLTEEAQGVLALLKRAGDGSHERLALVNLPELSPVVQLFSAIPLLMANGPKEWLARSARARAPGAELFRGAGALNATHPYAVHADSQGLQEEFFSVVLRSALAPWISESDYGKLPELTYASGVLAVCVPAGKIDDGAEWDHLVAAAGRIARAIRAASPQGVAVMPSALELGIAAAAPKRIRALRRYLVMVAIAAALAVAVVFASHQLSSKQNAPPAPPPVPAGLVTSGQILAMPKGAAKERVVEQIGAPASTTAPPDLGRADCIGYRDGSNPDPVWWLCFDSDQFLNYRELAGKQIAFTDQSKSAGPPVAPPPNVTSTTPVAPPA